MSGLLVLFLMTGLGLVGFLDDYIKIAKQRSLGLRAWAKLAGQMVVAVTFAILALQFPDADGLHPGVDRDLVHPRHRRGARRRAVRRLGLRHDRRHVQRREPHRRPRRAGHRHLGDGVRVLRAHRHLAVRQQLPPAPRPPSATRSRDPLDLAVVAAAVMGACFGFLWWNASPAKIFMGDTGSLALGGALAGLAILSRTELLLVLLGGLFVLDRAVGDRAGRLLQADRQTGVPDGAAAAPLRAGRAGARSPSSSGSGSSPGCSSRSASACSTPSGSRARGA